MAPKSTTNPLEMDTNIIQKSDHMLTAICFRFLVRIVSKDWVRQVSRFRFLTHFLSCHGQIQFLPSAYICIYHIFTWATVPGALVVPSNGGGLGPPRSPLCPSHLARVPKINLSTKLPYAHHPEPRINQNEVQGLNINLQTSKYTRNRKKYKK